MMEPARPSNNCSGCPLISSEVGCNALSMISSVAVGMQRGPGHAVVLAKKVAADSREHQEIMFGFGEFVETGVYFFAAKIWLHNKITLN